MTTPDLPERCCSNCRHSAMHLDAEWAMCLWATLNMNAPKPVRQVVHIVKPTDGTDCPAFEPADKEGTERE